MNEIIFEVRKDEVEGGFVAPAIGHAIATQGTTLEELREMARDAVRCHFGDGAPGPMPKIIRAFTSSATRPWRYENPPLHRRSRTLASPHPE